jgi:outer membrane protein OmpA-like peptidoglycan-associated protein
MVLLPALCVFLTAAPAGPAADLVDLLDFDQGSVLVTEPSSYGSGVSGWSAFRLSDGSVKTGWASAKGSVGPAEFVWELDQDATPKTLRVDTTGTEEKKYPGVSAKTLELYVAAATGEFEKVGSFEVPRASVKEFPVSVSKPVRRVKLVVQANHGSRDYTEVMEVDLLGAKTGPALAPLDVTGDYYSLRWNGLRMKQEGTRIFGCYDFAQGVFSGELDGRVAKVAWREFASGGKVTKKGLATFVVMAGQSKIRGIYFMDGNENVAGSWDLEGAKGPAQKARCQPPVEGMADQLKREGRVVVYGIHFDVNKDVPRPDSEPTLKEILSMLQSDGALKLQVEGHTDSTNTDAFNQALSERRATAVVSWLTGKGIDAARLKAMGFGRSRPAAGNETAQGRALNRRVELAPLVAP